MIFNFLDRHSNYAVKLASKLSTAKHKLYKALQLNQVFSATEIMVLSVIWNAKNKFRVG